MATKKTANKKTAKKQTAERPALKTANKFASYKNANKPASQKSASQKRTVRRPAPNPPPGIALIESITEDIMNLMEFLDRFTADLRALDRQRHNGVGLKRQGFIDAAFRMSSKFPQYFPHWLDTEKFQADIDLFNAVRSLVEVCRSMEEKAWNINVESSDMVYTNALEYYSQVKDAAHRRIDGAETLYNELNEFFSSHGKRTKDGEAAPTKKQVKRDFNALDRGTRDGKLVIENIKPKITGGKHIVVDETFKDTAKFRESEDGEIKE